MGADYLILKRRQQEDHRLFYEQLCKSNFKAGANAEWEIRTSGGIERMKTQNRVDAIHKADAAALNARRQRLADMLHQEQMAQEAALKALEETPEQRKGRMEARAKMLGDKREGERQEYVRSQYERQWRLACDPLREKESQAILKATSAARAYQIGEKMQQYEMEEQENRVFDQMWEQDRLAKLGREEREEAARKQMDAEQKSVLDRQVRELQDYRDSELELAGAESSMMREQWGLEAAESKRVEELRQAVLMKAHDELHQFNQHKRSQLAAAVKDEKEGDMERLNAVLQKEAAEDEKEARCRAAQGELTRTFAAHMIAQKRALASHEEHLEAERKKQLDKAWDKRLAEWGREQEAREKLMAQVLEERRMQVEVKLEQEKIDKVKSAHARSQLDVELQRINLIEAAKAEEARQVRLEHQALLKNQMKDKAFQGAANQYNKMQERMASERAEAQYQAMLQDQMDKTMSNMQKFSQATQGMTRSMAQ